MSEESGNQPRSQVSRARRSGNSLAGMGLIALLATLLAVTLGAWNFSLSAERTAQERELIGEMSRLSADLSDQTTRYLSMLHAGAAAFTLLENPGADHWNRFIGELDLRENYPEVEALAYITRLEPEQVPGFQAFMREQGGADFTVQPGTGAAVYCVLTFLADPDPRVADGFDVCSSEAPGAALLAATETGTAAVSGLLELAPSEGDDEDSEPVPGLVFAMPLESPYALDFAQGWLGLALPARSLLGDIGDSASAYHVRVVDLTEDAPEILMESDGAPDNGNGLDISDTVQVADRTWQVELSQEFQPGPVPAMILWGGVLVSLLLTGLLWSGYRTRARAVQIADRMTQALRESEERRRRTEELSLVMVVHLDLAGHWQKVTPRLCELLGRDREALLRQPALDVVHPDDQRGMLVDSQSLLDRREVSTTREVRLLDPDNEILWVDVSLALVRDSSDEPLYFMGFIQDITERKEGTEALAQREVLLEAIAGSLTELIRNPDFDAAVNQSLKIIGEAADADRAYIFEVHPHSEDGLPAQSMLYEWVREGVTAQIGNPEMHDLHWHKLPDYWYETLKRGQSLRVLTRELPQPARSIMERQAIKALLLVPMIRDGVFEGMIGFDDCRHERYWTESQLATLLAAAASFGNALQRQHTVRALEENRQLLSSITSNITDGIYRSTPEGQLVYVNQALAEMFGYDSPEEMKQVRAPILYVSAERRDELQHKLLHHNGYRGEEVEFVRRDGSRFVGMNNAVAIHDAEGNMLYCDGVITDITERKDAERQIHYLAHYDLLTGLPNRTLLRDRMEQEMARAKRDGNHLAVLFLDLDRFKNVNDSLGHAVGDQLLEQVGRRLQASIRGQDTVSRQGGDEFLIMLPDLNSANEAATVARKLIDRLSAPYVVGHHELRVTPSIGISLYPGDASGIEELVRNADAAMYQAKERGRHNFQFFTHDLSVAAWERLSLENQLRRAIQDNRFVLHYQPQVDIESGDIVGLEALVRWNHNGRLVSPSVFIPVAEQTGMIMEIGEWVLSEACRQACLWQDQGFADTRVTVNLSAIQFRRRNIVGVIQKVLAHTGLAPELLELELTESTVMEEVEESVRMLSDLSRIGVGLSVDDFGTGYSSLNYLKRFPIRKLKIDKSFIEDIPGDSDDEAITGAVIDMGRNLNLDVLAEGVETLEQLEFLKARGCKEFQGFLASHPVPADQVPALLRRRFRLVGS